MAACVCGFPELLLSMPVNVAGEASTLFLTSSLTFVPVDQSLTGVVTETTVDEATSVMTAERESCVTVLVQTASRFEGPTSPSVTL